MLSAQRRQLTVMFCDLVGSTELSARLDPEDMREILASYHRRCAQLIEATGGFVAKYMGDGILAYFGYPRAREHDAERAIRVALDLVEAVPALAAPKGVDLAVRVGIATGLVVVGDLLGSGPAEERAVVGETPNLAARLQTLAAPGKVVVADMTRALAPGPFDYRDMGPVSLKGLTLKEPVWEVTGETPLGERGASRERTWQTPMIGRDDQLERILELWRARGEGTGHVLGIVGEAGIGKSRLLREAHRRIAREPHVWVEGVGASLFSNSAFHLVAEMTARLLARHGESRPEDCLPALERSLRRVGMAPGALALIADLIGIPSPGGEGEIPLTAEQRRGALISTLADWLLRTARRWPTLLAVEDLQWADPSSVEMLGRLAEQGPQAGLLLIYTARRADDAPWPLGPTHSRIELDRLAPGDVRRLVSEATPALPAQLVESLVGRSGGVPLFAEELARLMAARGEGEAEREVPATLSDLLMERLDRMGRAKAIAQVASVIGRDSSPSLIAAVSGRADTDVRDALAALAKAEILIPASPDPDAMVSFSHALLQDAAYGALLRSQRRDLHRRVAEVLVSHFPAMVATRPDMLAQHWTAAGEDRRALAAWREAGHAAQARKAFHEAEAAYRRGLDILARLPEDAERDGRELALQSSLAATLQITRGYSAPETEAAATRANLLAQKGGDIIQQFRQAAAQWAALSSGGRFLSASRKADQVLELARMCERPAELAHAHMAQMTSRYRIGDLVGAEDFFREGVELFELPRFLSRPGVVGQTFGNAAQVAWILGDAAEGVRRIGRACELATSGGNPVDIASAEVMAAMFDLMTDDIEGADGHASHALEVARSNGFPQFEQIATICLGRVRVGQGAWEEGLALMEDGMARRAAAQIRVAETICWGWVAEGRRKTGALAGALECAEQALRANTQELCWRPDLLRLRGDLKTELGDLEAAEADYLEALASARTMRAKVYYDRAQARLDRLAIPA